MKDWKQVVTWFLTLAFGGVGGAIVNHHYSNQRTVVEYSVSRTAFGADQAAVIPDFKVGDTSLQSLFIYTVKILYSSGPELQSSVIGVEIGSRAVKLVGKTVAEGPSPVFHISCEPVGAQTQTKGMMCSVGRLGPKVGAYTVSFATDADATINVVIDANNADATQAAVLGATQPGSWIQTMSLILGALGTVAATVLGYYFGSANKDRTEFGKAATKLEKALQPYLVVDFEGGEGNRVEVTRKGGQNQLDLSEIYIRVRVRNLGLEIAKRARVFLTELREVDHSGNSSPTALRDSLQLRWAGWGLEPRDVPANVSFYADVIVISKNTAGWNFPSKEQFASMDSLKKYSGTYRCKVSVNAENALPAECEVDITYRQDWNTLRATQVAPKA